jgi:hypothetical protein
MQNAGQKGPSGKAGRIERMFSISLSNDVLWHSSARGLTVSSQAEEAQSSEKDEAQSSEREEAQSSENEAAQSSQKGDAQPSGKEEAQSSEKGEAQSSGKGRSKSSGRHSGSCLQQRLLAPPWQHPGKLRVSSGRSNEVGQGQKSGKITSEKCCQRGVQARWLLHAK